MPQEDQKQYNGPISTDQSKDNEKLDKRTKRGLPEAAQLVFFVSALSITASALYVAALSGALNPRLIRYFDPKDYVNITADWISLPLMAIAFFASWLYAWQRAKAEGYAGGFKLNPGEKRVSWLRFNRVLSALGWLWPPICWVLVSVATATVHFQLALFLNLVVAAPSLLWWITNSDNQGRIIKNLDPLQRTIRTLPAVYVLAWMAGALLEPQMLHLAPESKVYLESSTPPLIQGKLLFATTKYIIVVREGDDALIAIPASKVQRVETPPYPQRAASILPVH